MAQLPDDEIEVIRAVLDESEGVDARRIRIDREEDAIVLRGSVASSEEASAAAIAAEGAVESGARIDDRLQVDPNLREGVEDAQAIEPATPADDEVLVGDPDMLSGPEAVITDDLAEAMDENEPWEPPTHPHIPEPPRSRPSIVDEEPRAELDGESDGSPAAADVSEAELASGRLPSLDPERIGDDEGPPLSGSDRRESQPDDMPGPQVSRLPGTAPGPGAVGESTVGGGPIGSEPATETGARGVDDADADPARVTGGTSKGGGATRGPAADDDPAIRGPIQDDDPEKR